MKSDKIDLLAAAFTKAQAEMPVIKFDSENPFLKYKYASLGVLLTQVRPVLARHGLAVSQFPSVQNGVSGLTTILMHESGQFIEEFSTLPVEDKKGLSAAQTFGVQQTYLRRYALASILGLFADDDPDGQQPAETEIHLREWSLEQVQQVLDSGAATEDEDALAILNFSLLPGNVNEKTLASWLKHYVAADKGSIMECADVANEAYRKAKKGGK